MAPDWLDIRATGRRRRILPALFGLLFALAACAPSPASEDPEAFTLPVLTMTELRRLVDEIAAAKDNETAQPLAIARIFCAAKGYRPDGDRFAQCRERLVKAAIAKPGALAKARALARIAETLAALGKSKRRQPDGAVAGKGRPPLCYDLASAKLIVCEDI